MYRLGAHIRCSGRGYKLGFAESDLVRKSWTVKAGIYAVSQCRTNAMCARLPQLADPRLRGDDGDEGYGGYRGYRGDYGMK